jgi:hypothetical protein
MIHRLKKERILVRILHFPKEDLDYLTNHKGTNTNNSPGGRPGGNGSDSAQQRPIPDFTGDANNLWSLYVNEAQKHDTARIQTLKDDMDGVLIYVRQNVLCLSLYPLSD